MTEPDDLDKAAQQERNASSITLQFLSELVIFLAGLILGFLWYMYYNETQRTEIHFSIGLLVIIFCMGRYLFLLKKGKDLS